MATPNKTASVSVLALQNLASNTTVISSSIDVSTKFAGMICIQIGRTANTALTAAPQVRVEGSAKENPNETGFWFVLAAFAPRIAAITSQAVNGTCNAAQAVVPMASTTGMALFDYIYIKNSTIGNSEFGVIKSIISNTSVTIEDNLVNAQTGSTVYPSAERFVAILDLSAVKRLRLVINGANTGVALDVQAFLVELDSIA